jgi:hypothetical protein
MRLSRTSRKMPVGLLFLSLSLFVLAGCGNPAKATATTTTLSLTSATATACAKATRTVSTSSFKTTIGTLESINGQTLVLTSTQGSSATVTYSSSTHFTQEVNIPATSLQEGTAVRAAVASDGDSYDATTITVTTGTTGFTRGTGTPGAGNGSQFRNNPCFSRGQTGTSRTGTGSGSTTSTFRGLTGTVSELSGNVLTIADSTGTSYSVNITAKTQIVETNSVKATALKVGEPLTVIGGKGSQGAIAATTIAILLSLPTQRTPTSTPTP